MQEIRDFIQTLSINTRDTLLLCGDMNINSIIKSDRHLNEIISKIPPELENAIPLIKDEYSSMLAALEHPSYTLVDLLRQSAQGGQGTRNPVTYAEAKLLESGYYLEEPYLTAYSPKWMNESLDYVFWV
jgi:hypothetical protein